MNSTSPTTVMVGIFAILIGLIAAYGVRQAMIPAPVQKVVQQTVRPAPAPVPTRTIVMAKRNIAPNTCITEADVNVVTLPLAALERIQKQAGAVEAFPIEKKERALNRVTQTQILAGNWVTEEALYEFGKVPTIDDLLGEGEFAMAIPVSNLASVAGFIHPRAHVNISWLPNESIHPDLPADVAFSICKNVRVLATSAEMHEYNPGTPRAISNLTIAVTQKLANALSVLQKKGTFSVVLAAPGEENALEEDCAKERETLFSVLGLNQPEGYWSASASTDAWEGTNRHTRDFSGKEVLESINATRVVMNKLKPIKGMPKRSQDPDTMEVE